MIGRRLIAVVVFFLLVAACANPHNPYSFRHVQATPPATPPSQTYAPRTDKIWVTTADIPADVKYEIIETTDVGGKWYGGTEKAYIMLAKRARLIGADAVIRVSTWHQPSGWAWSAPHGEGVAIKLLDPKSFDVTKLAGGYY
ncbi:MAG: hypothetical protein K8R18_10390 [Parvibaculum sp.]|uniref:hypothetical protein n=1 Tax=Parvibaculum sp. TaxID=2024848 RepID=UPI0025FAE0DF|nr:hypothetical protein [Parvibaculum sp.]MCE9650019.1 hypothetical protein [Parvibaculum sp.]